jgi:Zn ribbon nucleic-acid-binding protein
MLSVIGQTRSIQEAVVHKRERFVMSVTCPVCALNGSATWEENESGNLETTIKSLSHGFRIAPGNEVHCADCGVKARIVGITVDTKQTG